MSNRKIYTTVGLPEDLMSLIDADAQKDFRTRSNIIVMRLWEHYKPRQDSGGASRVNEK